MLRSLLLASTCLLAACATTAPDALVAPPPAEDAAVATPVAAPRDQAAELKQFFIDYDKAELATSPLSKAYRGIKDGDYGKLDSFSDADAIADRELDQRTADAMVARFQRDGLSAEDQLSYDLLTYRNQRAASIFGYRRNAYVFDQMNGAQADIPAFLINIHKVENEQDAKDYISRINATGRYIDEAVAESVEREKMGVLPPKWVFPQVLEQSRNLISGAPFTAGRDNDLYADFKAKVGKLDIPQERKTALIAEAHDALITSMGPAYRRMIASLTAQSRRAGTDDGIWRFRDGAAQYQALLKYYTTTDLTGDQVHDLGLAQVARIHGEMEAIKNQVGFKGTLQQFFAHVRDGKQFYYPNTPAGKQRYIDESLKAQAQVQTALPRYFGRLPKTALLIKAVEPFREKSAGKAFYNDPPPDGSRPGTYYVNLYDMKNMPSVEVEALFCHEGIPGHHLQGALLSELKEGEVPPFRQFSGYTATDEGWGLYAEKLCKEMGLYTDPYRDFGRLQLELHRAIRLVVDSGLHHKRWSREQAIKYVEDNSADAKGGIVKAIERYIVYPGQATAYMVGKLKYEELRARSKEALGDKYDDRAFHDTVLLAGSMPLDMLEKRVDDWIARTKG
ncbi:DUF885 domain-containing protein [Sphingomonas sp. LY29]|uniref:DUF885 domain-containing protein n=1 Tax=Sphingomonas sp. LY29 TaxID=3095341 RepID=UPI002D77856E|nr:DUF885 domain-containing protein [Sphingomonas sp. LY29]WRP24782.1 DUF885 domain-containing protein [Sphingomonas sp. LY29]